MVYMRDGDLLLAEEAILGHQVNCMGVMGSGLAKQIREKYPEVYPHYVEYCKGCERGDRHTLLGCVQTVMVSDGHVIANLFGQYNYGYGRQHTDYKALQRSLEDLKTIAKLTGDRIALPWQLGCGRGGGDWKIVRNIIDEVFDDYDVTIYQPFYLDR